MATASRISGVSEKSDPENGMVPLYVWEWPVRITHWVIFLAIVVLTVTGYYLYDPFIISRGNRAFLMATMRFIHEIAGFVFIAGLLVRAYWFFVGNKWARWREFVPVGRRRWHDFMGQLGYYLFLRRKPPFTIGHNPLAGATYTVVYFLMLVEALTGLALYNHVLGSKTLGFFINWLPWLISIRYLRAIHFFIMLALWAFFIHHVYSAILIGIEERSGLVGSIFSGYKFFPERRLTEDTRRE
jgi:Ni/Fe-hydrogenase 1 B-type cytochrome subunit